MALKRHDILKQAAVPELGKAETSYPTPNKADLVVIERVPIGPSKYRPLPYHSPHPDYDNNGLFLCWQGKVRAENNQIAIVRVYSNDLDNQEWFNAAIKYAGDVRTYPVYTRSYITLREDYTPELQGSPLKKVMRLRVTASGTYTGTAPTASISGGGGTGATCSVIMNPAKTKVIALELLTEGDGFTSNPTIAFSSGTATAVAEIQAAGTKLVHEETTKLDSEDAKMASMFIKVHRVYETLPGPILVWDEYKDERGAIQRTSQSILASDVTGAGLGTEAATFTRNAGIVTKTWFEPRGDSAVVLTKFVETWTEVVIRDKRVTSQFGGAILSHNEDTDEPGQQTVETGLLVVSSEQRTKSPHEQTQITEKFDPSSALPVLELTAGGDGYASNPGVSFSGGTGSGAAASAFVGYPVTSFTVNAGGSGYTHAPGVRLLNALGGGGYAISTLGFGVADAIVRDVGSGYVTAPGVTVAGDGSGATAQAVLGFGVYFAFVTDPGGRAQATLTTDGTNPANNAIVTIGSTTYTFKTTMTPANGEVHIAGTANTTLLNLQRAINASGGTQPNDYKVAAAHPYVTALASGSSMVVTAIEPGTDANSIGVNRSTSPASHLTWSGATLSGGFSYTEVPRAIIEGTGFGSGADVIMGHPVSSIAVTAKGSGYSNAVVTVLFGVGSGLVAAAVIGYALASFNVTNVGSGLTGSTTVTIGAPDLTGGTQATATPVIAFGIASVTMTAQGSGYSTPPSVGFGAGSGTGAAGTAIIGYIVASATINVAGTGYTSFPSISISGGSGTGAAVNLRLGVEAVTIVNAGSDYVVNDILNIDGPTFLTQGQLRVTSVGGSGNITAVSIETVGVYTAISANPRTTTNTSSGTPTTTTYTYSSDGDANGVFYGIGTLFGAQAWTNPHTAAYIECVRSSSDAGSATDIVDRATNVTYSSDLANSFIFFDLGVGRTIKVSDYTIRERSAAGSHPRNWRLQGTNSVSTPHNNTNIDAATWTDIDVQEPNTSIVSSDQFLTLSPGSTTAYRYIRLKQTGLNSGGDNYLTVAEIELYGDLSHPLFGTGATFTVKYKVVQVNVTGAGTGYESAPGITIGAPGGGGTTATATANLAATGNIKRVQMTSAGTGYTADFSVTFSSGSAAGTAIRATTGGTLASITLNNAGDGYSVAPSVAISGGSSAAATAVLAATGKVWRVDITTGGIYESVPTVQVTGDGSGATIVATLDTTLNYVSRVHVTEAGHGYIPTPTVRFEYADGSVPTGLAATLTLLSTDGEVVDVNITAAGTGYTTATLVFDNSGTGGTGASADAILAVTGSVKSVTVVQGGLYESVPDVVFEGGGGTGADADAVLASTGTVVRLVLTATGSYTVAPTPVFTGSHTTIATAIYHLGTTEWPANPGFHTDETSGIVIDFLKKVISTGTPYPGRRPFPDYSGPFIDQDPYDRWKTIQIVSSVDLSTLPPTIEFPYWHHLHLSPRLLAIEVLWSDRIRKMGAGFKASAHGDVSTGLTGDIFIRATEGYHGQILGKAIRSWFLGPPPFSAIPPITEFVGSSGTAILTETNSRTYEDKYDDGGVKVGDEFNNIVRATDIRDHIIIPGGFTVGSSEFPAERKSLFQEGGGTSGGGTVVDVVALGTRSFLTTNLAYSSPTYDIRGRTFLVDVQPEQWRFNLWQMTLIYVTIPYGT